MVMIVGVDVDGDADMDVDVALAATVAVDVDMDHMLYIKSHMRTLPQFPCCCQGTRHRYSKPPYCGCFNIKAGLLGYVKNSNMKLMKKAGERKSPVWYKKAVKALFRCLTQDKHTDCKHHGSGQYYPSP